MSVATLARREQQEPSLTHRLLVTTQRPGSRSWAAVGFLSEGPDGWSFHYLKRALDDPAFTPLFGFDDLDRGYHSRRLFPLFSQRLMSGRRPDRPAYLEALALGPDARQFDVLARSGGRRAGDAVELLPVPGVGPGQCTEAYFLVHGVRHVPGAGDAIASLDEGQRLDLVDEPGNPVDPRALIVASDTGRSLGYVPAPLVPYVHAVREADDSVLTVVRASGPQVGSHLRLLVRLDGHYRRDEAPFSGSAWVTV